MNKAIIVLLLERLNAVSLYFFEVIDRFKEEDKAYKPRQDKHNGIQHVYKF